MIDTILEMPADHAAERSILGAILLDNGAYDEAAQHLGAADFALDSHQRIFARMAEMLRAGSAVDLVTLGSLLYDRKEADAVGGVAYVASLIEGLPRSLSITDHVGIVREKSKLRRVIRIGSELITRAADQTEGADELIASADQRLLSVAAENSDWPSLEKQSHAEIERMGRQRRGETPSYFDYGVPLLDRLVGGLVKKEMTVLGGRPGQGKSSLVSQIAVRHARRGVPVHIFTLEMSAGKFLRRIWSAVAAIPFHKLRHPERQTPDEYSRVVRAMAEVSGWPLVLDDAATLDIDQLVARARISKRRQGTEIVALDYLQKLRFSPKRDHRYMEVTDAAVKMARLAKEEDLAVLMLSSLTEGEKRERNRPPTLADFRQSGDIQFEASTALLIHREVDQESEKLKERGELIVAKARDDEQGVVPVIFNRDYLVFEEVSDVQYRD
jgi:replicative DNA helicase